MTDTTITLPIQIDTASIPAKGLERAAGLLAAVGRGIGAFLLAYGRATELAYCAPFQSPNKVTPPKRHRYSMDEDLAGRDPNW